LAAEETVSQANDFPEPIISLPPFAGPFDAFQLSASNCEVLFASYPAGTSIDPHSHPTENCGIITKGELILTVAGEEKRFGPGDWYHLQPEQKHSARFDVDTAEIEFWFSVESQSAT